MELPIKIEIPLKEGWDKKMKQKKKNGKRPYCLKCKRFMLSVWSAETHQSLDKSHKIIYK